MNAAQIRTEAAVKAHTDACPRQGASIDARIAWHQRALELFADMWHAFDTPQPIRDDITARHTTAIGNLQAIRTSSNQ